MKSETQRIEFDLNVKIGIYKKNGICSCSDNTILSPQKRSSWFVFQKVLKN